MPSSLTFDSFWLDEANGAVVPGTDTYYMMLVNGYTPNKGTHAKRSDVTSESSGTGYTAGGAAVTCTVAMNTTTHVLTLTFGSVTWTSASTTATGCVIYKHRGGLSSADNLVAYGDFGGTYTSTNGNFLVTESSPLSLQN